MIVLPLANKAAYLERYSRPDKMAFGLMDESRWPVKFWETDTAMAIMLILLAATDLGVGALYFDIARRSRPTTRARGTRWLQAARRDRTRSSSIG